MSALLALLAVRFIGSYWLYLLLAAWLALSVLLAPLAFLVLLAPIDSMGYIRSIGPGILNSTSSVYLSVYGFDLFQHMARLVKIN